MTIDLKHNYQSKVTFNTLDNKKVGQRPTGRTNAVEWNAVATTTNDTTLGNADATVRLQRYFGLGAVTNDFVTLDTNGQDRTTAGRRQVDGRRRLPTRRQLPSFRAVTNDFVTLDTNGQDRTAAGRRRID